MEPSQHRRTAPSRRLTTIHEEASDEASQAQNLSIKTRDSLTIAIEKELQRQEKKQQVQIPERKMWNSDLNLILACLGITLGMSSIWRFPKVAYENGGGAFLFACTVMSVFVSYPFFYLELIIGQYTRLGPSAITRCVPLAKGVEIAIFLVGFTVSIYFSVMLAQSLLHLFLTFVNLNILPVAGCVGFWEKKVEACYKTDKKLCSEKSHAPRLLSNHAQQNVVLGSTEDQHPFMHDLDNSNLPNCVNITETMNEHFFHVSVGMTNEYVGSVVGIQPELAICLALCWTLLFTCLTTGITGTRKKAFVLMVVPIGLMTFLMVGTLMEEDATYGVFYLMFPKWEQLLDIKIWANAVTQQLLAHGLAHGPVLVYGSFHHFNGDIHRAVFVVTGFGLTASIVYSVIVFSSLGRLALSLNMTIENVVHSGQSVVFVAMNKYSTHWLFSSSFFLLAVVAGTLSQVGIVEVSLIHLCDVFPFVYSNIKPFSLLYCIAGCLLGVPFVTQGGLYLLHMIDSQVVGFLLPFVALFETVSIIWIYGLEHLKLDVMLMQGDLSATKLEFAWGMVLPLILSGSVITNLLTGCSSLHFGPIEYPIYTCYVGWSLIIFGALQVPLWTIAVALSNHKRLDQCLLPASCQELDGDFPTYSGVSEVHYRP
ncbi:sodium- and chloride-dependent glycine transporter 2-like [Ornithodoros turicata]|uniref:sodium- and chloride-dependent glycine transporter 2-like n=1 Tax=Ornithodoros turicata TaxID=34597 RepID=UPI0031398075